MSKRENKISGNRGERAAEQYLRKNGYRILARNFTTDTGELDLVATDDAYLVFVEVKSRMSDDFGAPSEAVNFAKQRKLSMVASQYIEKNMLFGAPPASTSSKSDWTRGKSNTSKTLLTVICAIDFYPTAMHIVYM